MVGVTEVMRIIFTVNPMKVDIEMTVWRWVRRAVTARYPNIHTMPTRLLWISFTAILSITRLFAILLYKVLQLRSLCVLGGFLIDA